MKRSTPAAMAALIMALPSAISCRPNSRRVSKAFPVCELQLEERTHPFFVDVFPKVGQALSSHIDGISHRSRAPDSKGPIAVG